MEKTEEIFKCKDSDCLQAVKKKEDRWTVGGVGGGRRGGGGGGAPSVLTSFTATLFDAFGVCDVIMASLAVEKCSEGAKKKG